MDVTLDPMSLQICGGAPQSVLRRAGQLASAPSLASIAASPKLIRAIRTVPGRLASLKPRVKAFLESRGVTKYSGDVGVLRHGEEPWLKVR